MLHLTRVTLLPACLLIALLFVGTATMSGGLRRENTIRYLQREQQHVIIFHLIDNALWGEVDGSAIQGNFTCPSGLNSNNNRNSNRKYVRDFAAENAVSSCEIVSSDAKSDHLNNLQDKFNQRISDINRYNKVVVALYNIHTWGSYSKWPHAPSQCAIGRAGGGEGTGAAQRAFTLAESEESHGRFGKLFTNSFRWFDGNSTTSPFSSIQRVYFRGFNESEFLPLKPFDALIKGATFVASTCHRAEGTTKRVSIVAQLEKKLRVDSLGKCHHTPTGPEGIRLGSGATALEALRLKQSAISHYMFHLAFENTYERGYVTEKVFDALIAGVVPVYLGSSEDCRRMLPHPKAAIFVDDFGGDWDKLAGYLQYLMNNSTAYEEHRSWRHTFRLESQPHLFTRSWPCRICDWAREKAAIAAAAAPSASTASILRPLYEVNSGKC